MTRDLKHVLVVDDEQEWLEHALSAVGEHANIGFSNIHDANGALEDKKFDLVILDNNIHKHNAGVEFLHHLRRMGHHIPVIIHSSDLTPMAERQVAADNGHFVRKVRKDTSSLRVKVAKLLSS